MATTEERLVRVEKRSEKLEKKVDRYRRTSVVMCLMLAAGVTMGQVSKDVEFGKVTCQSLNVVEGGNVIVRLGADSAAGGNGQVVTYSSQGTPLVRITATNVNGIGYHGALGTYSPKSNELVSIGSEDGYGSIETFAFDGKKLIKLSFGSPHENGLIVTYRDDQELVAISAKWDPYDSSVDGDGVVVTTLKSGKRKNLD